jgi:hypothetical protein
MSRVEAALNLELALISGVPIDAWAAPAGIQSGRALVGEMEEHLRALLRDVVCGYLKPELASMADEILLQSEPVEIRAHDIRPQPHAVPVAVPAVDAHADFAPHPFAEANPHPAAAPHPLDPPTTFDSPAVFDPRTEVSLPPEHRSPDTHMPPEHMPPTAPATPHHERHAVREFALVPPEAEPRVTRLVDVINEPAPTRATPAPVHEQPALVVDDFAWDLDDPDDYSAPA